MHNANGYVSLWNQVDSTLLAGYRAQAHKEQGSSSPNSKANCVMKNVELRGGADFAGTIQ